MKKTSDTIKNKPRRKDTVTRPKPHALFVRFTLLSLVAFMILGALVLSGVRPALEEFVITQQEQDTVVRMNVLASELLTEEDFQLPLSLMSEENLRRFAQNIPIQAIVRTYIVDRDGAVLYSDDKGAVGTSFANNADVQRVLTTRIPSVQFIKTLPWEQTTLSLKEALVQIHPITFGFAQEAAGAVYTISRTGFFRTAIDDIATATTIRIVAGLAFLYFVLSILVGAASRLINRQSRELERYATGLEKLVEKRTAELHASVEREVIQAKNAARTRATLEIIRESEKMRSDFITTISHHLRTPVGGTKWFLDLLRKKRRTLSKETQNYIDEAYEANERTRAWVENILSVLSLEGERPEYEVRRVQFEDVVADCIQELVPVAEQEHVHVQVVFKRPKPKLPKIETSEERLHQVINNLVQNAIVYSKENGKVTVTLEQQDNRIVLTVADTGVGIPKKQQQDIFRRFFRADNVITTITGTGLGLYITKLLVEQLGGEIWFESTENKGSKFSVALPLTRPKSIKTPKT